MKKLKFKDSKATKAITFSYDDAVTQDIRLIELLNKYNLKCTFNINSELLGRTDLLVRNDNMRISHYKITKDSVKQIYEGHEVAAHTLTHPNLTQLDKNEIIRQVEEDRLNLSELVGYEVIGMAYPCGGVNNDERVAEVIKNNTGVKYARTITSSNSFDIQNNLFRFNPTVHQMNFDDIFKLGEEFLGLKTDAKKVFFIWGHSYEMDFDSTYWMKLENFFEMISSREDIFYGTNSDVLL